MALRLRPLTLLGNGITTALWIAVCAMTPEAIWRGSGVFLHDVSWADVADAVLLGLILAFCIEPAIERLRHLFFDPEHKGNTSYGPMFAATAGIVFAMVSVCLHDAMTAFIETGAGAEDLHNLHLANSLRVALAWAFVPFFTALAWVGAAARMRIAWPLGVLAFLSPLIDAWLFQWSAGDTVTTFAASTLFLWLGYRARTRGPLPQLFARTARSIAIAAPLWLVFALLVDQILALTHLTSFRLYTAEEVWIDLRFYCGWGLGLLLAPFPLGRTDARDAEAAAGG